MPERLGVGGSEAIRLPAAQARPLRHGCEPRQKLTLDERRSVWRSLGARGQSVEKVRIDALDESRERHRRMLQEDGLGFGRGLGKLTFLFLGLSGFDRMTELARVHAAESF